MKLHLPSILFSAILFIIVSFQVLPDPCCLTQAQKDVLNLLSVVNIEDCIGGPGYKTLRVTNANFQVVNGLDSTSQVNGLGNIIVGYHDCGTMPDRTGSHNLIVGDNHAYTSWGSLLAGQNNASLSESQVVFGFDNITSDRWTNILGGMHNTASGEASLIAGGVFNDVFSSLSCIVGGADNSTAADHSVVLGGQFNISNGPLSVVGGGLGRSTASTGVHDFVAGSIVEDN